jgi:hypothetical protein
MRHSVASPGRFERKQLARARTCSLQWSSGEGPAEDGLAADHLARHSEVQTLESRTLGSDEEQR